MFVSNLFLTLVITFLLIVIGIACLAAGWLISGRKPRYDRYRDQLKSPSESIQPPKTPPPGQAAPNRFNIDENIDIEITEEDSNKGSK